MNRRGFVSLLAGSSGALFVPWRHLIAPVIFLPPPPTLVRISGLQAVEWAAPQEWLSSYSVNQDASLIRSDHLELLHEQYARRMALVNRLSQRRSLVVPLGARLLS